MTTYGQGHGSMRIRFQWQHVAYHTICWEAPACQVSQVLATLASLQLVELIQFKAPQLFMPSGRAKGLLPTKHCCTAMLTIQPRTSLYPQGLTGPPVGAASVQVLSTRHCHTELLYCH